MELNTNDNGTSFFNLNFVTEAFRKFKQFHVNSLRGNTYEKTNSIYVTLSIKKSAPFLEEIYTNYINNIFNLFFSVYITESEIKKIKNINSFFEVFTEFAKISMPAFPITKSNYILHKACDPAINGLVISFETDKDTVQLEKKVSTYIQDTNFEKFLINVKRFGFYVDKNFPWKIIADLESPFMKEEAKRYGMFSTDEIFSKGYHVAYYSDLDDLKVILYSFWNAYIRNVSFSAEQKEIPDCKNLFGQVNTLAKISQENFNKQYSQNWFIRMYIFLKLLENKSNVTQNEFENIYQESIYLNQFVDEKNCLDYIHRKIKEIKTATINQEFLTTPEQFVKLLQEKQKVYPLPSINF